MEVGAFDRKGKAKGPGKDGGGGKAGDAKGRETRTCNRCGKVGHLVANCWAQPAKGGKGGGDAAGGPWMG